MSQASRRADSSDSCLHFCRQLDTDLANSRRIYVRVALFHLPDEVSGGLELAGFDVGDDFGIGGDDFLAEGDPFGFSDALDPLRGDDFLSGEAAGEHFGKDFAAAAGVEIAHLNPLDEIS